VRRSLRLGQCWADGYVELSPAILQFEGESTLVATYAGTARARAKTRRTKRFSL